jgi:hypothetical protein
MGQMKIAFSILVRKPDGKGRLGRHRHKCENNIKMDLRETGWEDVDCIHVA